MKQSPYTSLPTTTFTIRLLQLHPSAERSSPIGCSLITYPLSTRPSGAHLFEALSYVWGSQDDQRTIFIDSDDASSFPFQVTRNLHVALLHLRDPTFARIIWVDAICINQEDDDEKSYQVGSMAKIYGLAQRVVVWLGEESEDSALAFRDLNEADMTAHVVEQRKIRDMAEEDVEQEATMGEKLSHSSVSENENARRQQAVSALLDRPYFRRIWIQQELAASRNILFVCGDSQCEGETFRESRTLAQLDEKLIKSHSRTLRWLLRVSSTRQSLKGGPSLSLRSLSDLVDMFHDYEASDLRDKIYALLGMCTEETLTSGLWPDYSVDWKILLTRLGTFMFGKNATISAHQEKQLMFIHASGFMLGMVNDVTSDGFWSDTQTISVMPLQPYRHLDDSNRWNIRCNLRKSSKIVEKNDLILLTEETKKIIFVRPDYYYFRVINVIDSISAAFIEDGKLATRSSPWYPFLKHINTYPMMFGMIWDWHENQCENERESLLLMKNNQHDDVPSSQQYDVMRVKALIETAQTLEDCGANLYALDSLKKAAQFYNSLELADLVPADIPARLVRIQRLVLKLQKARSYISKEWGTYNDLNEINCREIIGLAGETCPPLYHYFHSGPNSQMWIEYASLSMCYGNLEDMMTAALSRGLLDRYSFLADFAREHLQQVHQKFLVSLSSSPIPLDSFDVVTEVLRWAKQVHGPITNLAEIIKASLQQAEKNRVYVTEHMEKMIAGLLADTNLEIVIHVQVIEMVLALFSRQWNKNYSLSILLEALPQDIELSKDVKRQVFDLRLGMRV